MQIIFYQNNRQINGQIIDRQQQQKKQRRSIPLTQAVQNVTAMDVEQRGSTPQFQQQDLSASASPFNPDLVGTSATTAQQQEQDVNSINLIGNSEFGVCLQSIIRRQRIEYEEFDNFQ
eukprot:TRINITY_DN2066_c1_g2_i4.p4 TRINITY_DN2066_c1_g2~~TRINITY_DN2066_c1_g2_i4.p4  ORF type:complete len:118 (-),score=5.36 TRINITY_DN2066_c1_g2_i4:111-464(-)